MTKFSVDESGSDTSSTADDTAVERSEIKGQNENIPQLSNYEEVWENDIMPTVFSANQPKPVNESTSLSVLSQLDDQNIGKYFVIYWSKPKAYYWGELLHLFSKDDDDPADEVEIQFLSFETSADPSQIKWNWPAKVDKEIVDAKFCYLEPSVPNISDSSHSKSFIQFSQKAEARKIFNRICKHTS